MSSAQDRDIANHHLREGSEAPASPPMSPDTSPSRSWTPDPKEVLLGMIGSKFHGDTQDIHKADPDAKVPGRVQKNVDPYVAVLSMAGDPSTSVPDTSAGSETASNHSTVAGTSTVSPKTSMDSTSERGVEEPTPLAAETSSPPPSTRPEPFDLTDRTRSNSDAHPTGDNSAPSQADKENKRKASASETDTTPHKKAAPSDAWLD